VPDPHEYWRFRRTMFLRIGEERGVLTNVVTLLCANTPRHVCHR
jgi:hypothetical protein